MLNTDASLSSNIQIAGLGGVFRNSSGKWIMGFTAHALAKDIFYHELQALFVGLQMALLHNLGPLEINIDAEQIIKFFTNTESNPNNSALLADCRFLLLRQDSPPLIHIYREQNRLADSFAKRAITAALPSSLAFISPVMSITTFWVPPQDSLQILCGDERGDITTRCVKAYGVLSPSVRVNIPNSLPINILAWPNTNTGCPINIALSANTMMAVPPNSSL
ncbi:hypothetical protein FXO38_20144 [Capsicum annuum]|nr:hypothetical protein FXO38_20144 [Capsicum annuum]KAF3683948.1 hypothetical protein FXO37_01605 [Capsicum annuum]